ncbi:hypothetical protein A9Q99_10330 [Gammaproteobacteria bacterium 45_16_T64]|nr:hypothetical protein A9Q99_10330 [Gammaproteobacteria bacterium 45_16_T64]
MSSLEPNSVVKSIEALSVTEVYEMHEVFVKYYNNADFETFVSDIYKKQHVLLITDRETNRIVGFSTLAVFDLEYKGKKAYGIFSGDTILEKKYWGSRRWQFTWAMFFLRIKLKNPLTPFFWLLISKGYKTYLLLANNFVNYYPRIDHEDSDLANLVDAYCNKLYPEYYNQEDKILDFGNQYQNLKDGVAEIIDDLKTTQPKIHFFEEKNPEWRRGTELPCVGLMEIPALINFIKKVIREKTAKSKQPAFSEDMQSQ